MVLSRWRNRTLALIALSLALVLFLAACGDAQKAQTPAPSPTPPIGQRLLTQTGNALNTAKTLQGLLSMTVSGQSLNGTLNTQIWNATPAKSRSEVQQSTLSQFPTGAVTVSDGKKIWQYDPVKNVVYSGAAQPNSDGSSGGLAGSSNGGRSQFVLNLVQSIFTQSIGTLRSSTSTVDGHAVYDISVVPQDNANSTVTFNYSGDIYIDKTTQLPVKATLNIQSFGDVVLGFQKLILNQPVPANTFTFTVPAGAKELPLAQANQIGNGNLISLAQAQQQAGFHLLSIPADQSDYVLQGVNVLGAPGSQIYTLHYMKGSTSFTIAQGKPLANLPISNSQSISMRGVTASVSNQNGNTALIWTEKGIGINLTGLSKDQGITVAQSLK